MADDLYIGLISGTSLDGIDAVLVRFENEQATVVEAICAPFSSDLINEIKSLIDPATNEINRLMALDVQLGNSFAEAVKQLLVKAKIK
ncbi:MAG: anhydro-N-acetylmuramic acid kinase, partial [Gammaproteobacteria bacterium]|nr:anhydro-N-acetylmuramic acid kinase [Gammaproteobacteria bacterium]